MHASNRVVTVDGADLYVEERGHGEPLVLLHGMTGTGGDWSHVFNLDALAEHFHVIVPDARGHGRSTSRGDDFTFARCGHDVVGILDSLGLAETYAVGVSLGAKTLLHAATTSPARFRAMILVSATPNFPEETRALFRGAAAVEHSPEEWVRMRKAHVHGDTQIAALWRLPARFADDTTDMAFTAERLGTVTARTLVVSGDRDPFYPVELAVELYRGIPQAALWIVPEALHGPIFLGHREAFVHEVMRFFRV